MQEHRIKIYTYTTLFRSCASGWDDCNTTASDGCEADLSRTQTCGTCSTICGAGKICSAVGASFQCACPPRSEEHTSELQSRLHHVCRLLLEKKKYINKIK